MKKLLTIQKVLFVLFIVSSIAFVIYSLGFMTEYEDFMYLSYRENQPLYEFHQETLLPFNNLIFYLSIVGVVFIILIFVAKLKVNMPKVWQLIAGVVATIPAIVGSIYSMANLSTIKSEYLTFDFSHVAEETYQEYKVSTLAFDIGNILFPIILIVMVLFIVILAVNCSMRKSYEHKEHLKKLAKA